MTEKAIMNHGVTEAMRIVQTLMIPERNASSSVTYFKLLDLLEYLYERGNEFWQ